MVVNDTTFISDATLFLRDLLVTGVTDPISSGRPTDAKFIMTSYPGRRAFYPLITVVNENITGTRDGMRSEGLNARMIFEIRVWAKDVKQRDTLSQNVITVLRQNQTDASTGSIANNLFNLSIDSAVNVDEDGENAIHSKVLSVSYSVFIDG